MEKAKKSKAARKAKKGKVSVPAAISRKIKQKAPSISGLQSGAVRVKHRELITEVKATATGAWALCNPGSFSVNPGLQTFTYWLQNIARNYDYYVFQNLSIHYVPYVGSNTAGALMFAVDFDAADSPPDSMYVMANYNGVVTTPVWAEITMPLSAQNLKKFAKERLVRTGTVANTDIKTYDVATLHVASLNGAATTVYGTLWVEYVVDFSVPSMPTASELAAMATLRIDCNTGVSKTNCLGTAPVLALGSLPVHFTGQIPNEMIFDEAGDYMITNFATGTGLDLGTVLPTLVGAATQIIFENGTGAPDNSVYDSTNTHRKDTWLVRALEKGVGMAWTAASTTLTALTSVITPGTPGLF